MTDAYVQGLLQILISRPASYMKPEFFTGNESKDIITWTNFKELLSITPEMR